MFDNCNSLAELNAARISATSSDNADIVSINNAYNKRRKEILAAKATFVRLTPQQITTKEPVNYCGIPVTGRSPIVGQITITNEGILY